MLIDYARQAVSNLFHRKLRSWLTMIGIFIGIAAVVSLIGLGEGLRGAIIGQFGFLGPDVLTVQAGGVSAGPPGSGVVNPLTDRTVEKLEKIAGVEAVVPRYIQSGRLEFNDRQDIVFAWNVPVGEKRSVFERMVNLKAEQGRLLTDTDSFRVVLGNRFTEEDEFGKPVEVGNNILFNDRKFKVVGILEKKGSFIFDTAVIMNEDILTDNFRENDNVDAIAVKVEDLNSINQIKEKIEQELRKERRVKIGEEDFTVESAEAALDSLDSTLFAVQLFVIIIALISILVGGIGISNTMYTAVLERTKEIGIMKSIGAKNSAIFTLFFIESGLLGLVGGTIGALMGVVLAFSFAFAGRVALDSELIQAQITPELVLGALLFSFIVGLLAGIIPAVQAARKNPVDSLRYAK